MKIQWTLIAEVAMDGRGPGRDSRPETLEVSEASCEGGWAPDR